MGSSFSTAASSLLLAAGVMLTGCTSSSPLPSYGIVPDFTLTDQSNRAFRSAENLKRKVWIVDFIFTNCPGPCPRMTSLLRKVQQEFEGNADVKFVSITVDPKRDTPEALAEYAKRFHADESQWSFLTGPTEELQRLSREAFKLGDIDGSLEHSTRFVLVDKFGRIRGFYPTTAADSVPQLVTDAKGLLKEKI